MASLKNVLLLVSFLNRFRKMPGETAWRPPTRSMETSTLTGRLERVVATLYPDNSFSLPRSPPHHHVTQRLGLQRPTFRRFVCRAVNRGCGLPLISMFVNGGSHRNRVHEDSSKVRRLHGGGVADGVNVPIINHHRSLERSIDRDASRFAIGRRMHADACTVSSAPGIAGGSCV